MRFDINLIRGIITVLWCSLFIAISLTAWSRRKRTEFDAAARAPLESDSESLSGP